MTKVIILMGSKSDLEFVNKITKTLKDFEIHYELRIASAHKTPEKVLEILQEHERRSENLVYITVAGRSNALSGMVDANTRYPVIACPPYSEKFSGVDVFSSLRMPSGVAPLVVLEPESAALAAVKILSLKDSELGERVSEYQKKMKDRLEREDEELRKGQ